MEADEKKCPFCAEIIKSEAIKCRFCGSDLSHGSGTESEVAATSAPSAMACEKCNVLMVPVQKKKAVSLSGLVSVALFVVGIVAMLANVIIGAVLLILALVIGHGRREEDSHGLSKLQCRGQHCNRLMLMPNKRVNYARTACPTRKSLRLLLAGYARRSAAI